MKTEFTLLELIESKRLKEEGVTSMLKSAYEKEVLRAQNLLKNYLELQSAVHITRNEEYYDAMSY